MKRNHTHVLLLAICLIVAACSPAPAPTEVIMPVTETLMPSTPTITPSPTPTGTPLPPMILVNEQAKCYSGPGENGYQMVATFESGEQMNAVGKDASDQYWIVIDPKSNKGCWVESRYISIQGEISALPNLIPPPTSVSKPNAPEIIDVTYLCQRNKNRYGGYTFLATITITWKDTSNNETGFEIYKNGNLWKTFDANVVQTYDEIQSRQNVVGNNIYTILAFNDAGNSLRAEKTLNYHCP